MPASLIESPAIGLGNIELAVGVLGEALLLGHGLDGPGGDKFSVSSRSTS